MLVRLSQEAPLHLQLYRAFREAILSGKMTPGSRLPSSRVEARTLGVSRNVVLQAYGQLEAEGYIGGNRGSGTYVSSEIPDRPPPPKASKSSAAASAASIRLSEYARRAPATTARGPRRLPYDFAYGFSRPDPRTVGSWQRALRRATETLSLDYGPPLDSWIASGEKVGVGLYSVAPYYLSESTRPGLLFGYGNLEVAEIREGIRRFALLLSRS